MGILRFCNDINKYINIACFSTDDSSVEPLTMCNDSYAVDFSVIGFALVRMWTQYGSNNKGLCFIFKKKKS